MALIIICLVGYIVYAKFIQKNDSSESKSNNQQEQEKTNPQPTSNAIAKDIEESYGQIYKIN